MENSRYLECLAADYTRLREVVGGALRASVPTCPDWSVSDLVYHVAVVFLHKTEAMRRGEWPRPWPPDRSGEPPLAALDRAYAALVAEFAQRKPDEQSVTWFEPDQTVGFWVRRMAQECVIHRVDGELGAGASIAPIPADLAIDGIDEVLVRFLAFASTHFAEDFGDRLKECDGRSIRVTTNDAGWLVTLAPDGVLVASGDGPADATVSGDPADVLLWLWRRVGDERVGFEGDEALIAKLRQLLGDATV